MRIALIAVIVIGTLTILGSLVPTEQRNVTRTTPSTTTTGPPPVVGEPVAFTAPRKKVVRAEVGDTLVMTIERDKSDWIRALDLGFEQFLPANQPTVIRFPATRTGKFELRTGDSDEVVATLVIADRSGRPEGEDVGPGTTTPGSEPGQRDERPDSEQPSDERPGGTPSAVPAVMTP